MVSTVLKLIRLIPAWLQFSDVYILGIVTLMIFTGLPQKTNYRLLNTKLPHSTGKNQQNEITWAQPGILSIICHFIKKASNLRILFYFINIFKWKLPSFFQIFEKFSISSLWKKCLLFKKRESSDLYILVLQFLNLDIELEILSTYQIPNNE